MFSSKMPKKYLDETTGKPMSDPGVILRDHKLIRLDRSSLLQSEQMTFIPNPDLKKEIDKWNKDNSPIVNINNVHNNISSKSDYDISVVLLSATSKVGKTELAQKLTPKGINKYDGARSSQSITYPNFQVETQQSAIVNVKLSELAGSFSPDSRFSDINCHELDAKGADIAILVVDITNAQSLDNLEQHIDNLPKESIKVLVGNKVDISDENRLVTEKKAGALVKKKELYCYVEVSATKDSEDTLKREILLHPLNEYVRRKSEERNIENSLKAKNEKITVITNYIQKRNASTETSYIWGEQYYSFWGRLFGHSKDKKIAAAKALLNAVTNNSNLENLSKEHSALKSGDLGALYKAIKK